MEWSIITVELYAKKHDWLEVGRTVDTTVDATVLVYATPAGNMLEMRVAQDGNVICTPL